MKRYLAKQPRARNLKELQAQLDTFARYYNDVRPHRSLQRRTPRSVYDARVKARPGDVKDATAHFRVRYDKVDTNGTVTLRYGSRLLHLGMGRKNAGQVVTMLVADRDVRVLNPEGVLTRRFTIDPKRNYQRPSEKHCVYYVLTQCLRCLDTGQACPEWDLNPHTLSSKDF